MILRFVKLILLVLFLWHHELWALSCQEEFEKAIRTISDNREARWGNNSKVSRKFFDEILDNEVKLSRKIRFVNKSGNTKLAELLNNNNPADIQYLLNKKKLSPDFSGGESDIFVDPLNNNEALKIYHPSRRDDFEISTKALLHYEAVSKKFYLSDGFVVTKVKEIGEDYVVKEFFPGSRPISEFSHLSEVKKKISDLNQKLNPNRNDAFVAKIANGLSKQSANLHWDPVQKKIILIDALGF